ncbi:hypothetical protein AVEN_271788-1 [Araneus ventricosus]|uniref:Uncharacterized protein n=1 Tax=Araneus ventricosus TaxID=182803 RepID=A0A4Y2IHI3_ARAVE|nr:hypothetical protein AVEN_271788-1 [Araneus ventricosus]
MTVGGETTIVEKDKNWYLFPDSLLQNGNSNDPRPQTEAIHDIYTVKGSDDDIRRVHYALDEHGLRANIYSKVSGHGPNIETNSLELEPRRWPSDDFNFNLEKFLSMRPTKQTSSFSNFERLIFPKKSPVPQDISISIPNRETKVSAAVTNTPLSIYSKRLFSKFVPNNLQQIPYTGKTFGDKNSFVSTADNENILKYQGPSVVSSHNYARISEIPKTNGFFESQRIPKPATQSYHRPTSSFHNFSYNASANLTKNLTDIPITKTEEDEGISQSEAQKSSLNLEIFPRLQTKTSQPENEEHVESQYIQIKSPLNEPVFIFNLPKQTDTDKKINGRKPIPFQPDLNDITSTKMKTQSQPNYRSLSSTSFGSSLLSTIFDCSSDKGGPYYHYVMNIGKNSGDTVTELIEKYLKLNNTNEQINEDRKSVFSGSTKNINKSGTNLNNITNDELKLKEERLDSNENNNITNNITNDELKLKEERSDSNENNNTIPFYAGDLNESFDTVDFGNRSRKISHITLKEKISSGNEIQDISESVNGEIIKIVNDQVLSSLLVTKNNVTDVVGELKIMPFQLVEIDEIMDTSYSNDSSLNQVSPILEEHTREFTDSDSTTGFQSERFENTSRDIISANTTEFPSLKFSDINPTTHGANESKEFATLFAFAPTFNDSVNTVPEILLSDKLNGTLLNLESEELNVIFKSVPENSSALNDLISQVKSNKVSSADIPLKSYENDSAASNTYYPDKSVINIMAKLNLLRPDDEFIPHNEISPFNSSHKEGRVLNSENSHPVLEMMIPKAEMNDFIMKINNTPVLIRILHPELIESETIPHVFTIEDGDQNFSKILHPELIESETIPHVFTIQDGDPKFSRILHPELMESETIPHVFTLQDGDQNFLNKYLESNYNSNFIGIFNKSLNLIQPNSVKDSTISSSEPILPLKITALESINNTVNRIIIPMRKGSKRNINFSAESLFSDLLDN